MALSTHITVVLKLCSTLKIIQELLKIVVSEPQTI